MQKYQFKKILATVSILLISSASIFAAFGKPAAIVKFNGQTMAITQDELDQQYSQVASVAQAQGLDETTAKKQVLDGLINNKLFDAAAKRDGITIGDDVVAQLYAQQKYSIEQQAGRVLTDKEFEQIITQNAGSVDAYKEYLRNQQKLQQYILSKKGNVINNTSVEPTTAEIESFYRAQKTKLINPESVNIAQIFIPFKDNTTNNTSEKTLEKVLTDLKAKKISWNDAVKKYSQDSSSSSVDGDIGWVTLDDTQNVKQTLGNDFFNTCFELKVDEISDVIKSSIGYHIIKSKQHYDAKFLALDDPISPADTMTVREYIKQTLMQQKAQSVFESAVTDLSNELRDQATISIFI